VTVPAPAETAGQGVTPIVELRGIRKSYGDLLVNDGVDHTPFAGGVQPRHGEKGGGNKKHKRLQ
jgi:hypothetical protein